MSHEKRECLKCWPADYKKFLVCVDRWSKLALAKLETVRETFFTNDIFTVHSPVELILAAEMNILKTYFHIHFNHAGLFSFWKKAFFNNVPNYLLLPKIRLIYCRVLMWYHATISLLSILVWQRMDFLYWQILTKISPRKLHFGWGEYTIQNNAFSCSTKIEIFFFLSEVWMWVKN